VIRKRVQNAQSLDEDMGKLAWQGLFRMV
jgi:hypothetical protein